MTLKEMKDIVCKDRPELAKLFENGHAFSISEYYKNTAKYEQQFDSASKDILIRALTRCINAANLTIDEKAFAEEFRNTYTVGTADHTGPLTHTFFSNDALLESNLAITENNKFIVHLSCGGISMDNSSYPRGFLLHNKYGELVRIPLVSWKEHRKSVYGLQVRESEMYRHASVAFEKVSDSFDARARKKIITLLDNCLDQNNNTLVYYSDVVSRINKKIWETLYREKCTLVTLDQESLVREILLDTIGTGSVVDEILFDTKKRSLYLEKLDGAVGAQKNSTNEGTELFWFVGAKTRERMQVQADKLHAASAIQIALEPHAIKSALRERRIYPNMALTFTVLCHIYGLRTGGGFCQINYLPEILDRVADWAENDYTLSKQNQNLFRGEFTLASFEINGKVVQATPLDLIAYAPPNWQNLLDKKAADTTLADALCGMMSEFYKITTGAYVSPTDAKQDTPLWHVA